MKQWIVTLTLLTSLLCSLGASGWTGIHYVKAGASGTGTSWADASGNLQDMINAAAAGDEIWVAAGTYKPGSLPGATGTIGARDVAFVLKEGVKIYGGFAGTETMLSERNTAANPTILSGDIGVTGDASDNAHHVVISINNTNATLLDGFIITGGNANGEGTVVMDGQTIARTSGGGIFTRGSKAVFNHITVTENRSETTNMNGNGGGIYSINSGISISASVISNNESDAPAGAGGSGGGIYTVGNADSINTLSLTDVTVSGNTCKNSGAGIYAYHFSNPVLENVIISENEASASAGGMIILGNAASNNISKLTNVQFLKNKALGGRAGGLFLSTYTSSILNDITFTENTSSALAGALYGLGNAARFSEATIDKIRFLRNGAGGAGGGMYLDTYTNFSITNAEFTENKATGSGGAFYVVGGSEDFNNFSITGGTISKNTATSSGGAAYISSYTNYKLGDLYFLENTATGAGGALFLFSAGGAEKPNTIAQVYNSVFYGNEGKHSTLGGGGIFVSNNTSATISGCTFYGNKTVADGGALGVFNSQTTLATVSNSIFYSNTSNEGAPDITSGANSVVTHSLTQTFGTNGVDGLLVGVDPQFVSIDPANTTDFLRLQPTSPAKDAGNNSSVPAEATKDLDGNERIAFGTVDMGAFEYPEPTGNLPQTITFTGNITKTYGDASFSPNATASSGLPVNYTSSNTDVAIISNNQVQIVGAGTTEIIASQPGNEQYLAAEPVSVTLTVEKAELTIRPDDVSVQQGAEFPVFTATYIGLVNGDTESSLINKPTFTTTATSNSPLGEYPLTASGAASNNYNISYLPGTLTIIPAVRVPAARVAFEAWFSSNTELQVTVDMTHAQTATLAIYNNNGIPVYAANVELLPGANSFSIPADRLLPGVYIINVKGSGLKLDKKIIKR
jgi:hypothetical protein